MPLIDQLSSECLNPGSFVPSSLFALRPRPRNPTSCPARSQFLHWRMRSTRQLCRVIHSSPDHVATVRDENRECYPFPCHAPQSVRRPWIKVVERLCPPPWSETAFTVPGKQRSCRAGGGPRAAAHYTHVFTTPQAFLGFLVPDLSTWDNLQWSIFLVNPCIRYFFPVGGM